MCIASLWPCEDCFVPYRNSLWVVTSRSFHTYPVTALHGLPDELLHGSPRMQPHLFERLLFPSSGIPFREIVFPPSGPSAVLITAPTLDLGFQARGSFRALALPDQSLRAEWSPKSHDGASS